MRRLMSLAIVGTLLVGSSVAQAAGISGQYLESRTCEVYTGPCFANAEMDLAGREAVMAWKVDEGRWNGVSLNGLSAALVVNAENTLGYDGIFEMKAGRIKSVVLVDEQATPAQKAALISFVKESAKDLAKNVVHVEAVAMNMDNDYLSGAGKFTAGNIASIETRELRDGDCVCTNEEMFYQPLSKVENVAPVYSKTLSYQGGGLNNQWTTHGTRSAFLATFSR